MVKIFSNIKLIICCFFLTMQASCIKEVVTNVPKITEVYNNNFELYDQKGIQVQGHINGVFQLFKNINIVDYNDTKVLGDFNNSKIDLKLDSLPLHNTLNIQFDLYIHDNWRNDMWKMEFDNKEVLVTGFSNNKDCQQAYPNWINAGYALNSAGSNAFDLTLKGACRYFKIVGGTSLYRMERTIIHSDSTFKFSASDAGEFFELTCDRSWSIDNLKISAIYNITTK